MVFHEDNGLPWILTGTQGNFQHFEVHHHGQSEII
jgi:hypothetical protein